MDKSWRWLGVCLALSTLFAQPTLGQIKLGATLDVPAKGQNAQRRQPDGPLAPAAASTPLGYLPANALNLMGTYTDLGTTGRGIGVGANTDNANSTAQDIGFTFRFRGVNFTKFILNTNGFIKLGSSPPSRTDLFFDGPSSYTGGALNSSSAADSNIIAVFNHDLGPSSTSAQPQFRVATTGTTPNRVCTIQWKNMIDMQGTQFKQIQFQLKLYETTNWIDFVFGEFIIDPTGTSTFKSAGSGLRGSSNSPSQLLYGSHYSLSGWEQTAFTNRLTNSQGQQYNQHNFQQVFLPDAGRTYRFTSLLDKNVRAFELLGLPEFASCTNTPSARVGVVVVNSGKLDQTNVPVSLKVGSAMFNATLPRLDSAGTDTVFFGPVDFSQPGALAVKGYTHLAGDMIPENDTISSIVRTLVPVVPAIDPDTNSVENATDTEGWITYDRNGDQNTWGITSDAVRARTGTNSFFIRSTPATRPDDWLVSSCFTLDSGKVYGLGFSYRTAVNANMPRDQSLKLYMLRGQSPADTFHLLWNNPAFYEPAAYVDTVIRFQADSSGTFYMAWWLNSIPNNGQLFMDDIFMRLDTGIFIANKPHLGEPSYTLAPNPARDRISLKGQTLPKGAYYALAADGKRIRLEEVVAEPKERSFRLNALRPGIYTLISGDGRRLGRFAKTGD